MSESFDLERWDPLVASAIRSAGLTLDEDLMQVGRLAAWQGLNAYDPTKGNVAAFLTMVVRHRSIDYLRRQSGRRGERVFPPRDPHLSGEYEVPDPADPVDNVVDRLAAKNRLSRILRRSSCAERRVLEAMLARPDVPATVIARGLSCTESTVWSHLSHVRSREVQIVGGTP